MRSTIKLFLASLAVGVSALAQAQPFPSRPIAIVVSYSAGGTNDIIARVVGAAISKTMGVPVVVENRVGGSGGIGAAYVAKSAPDGYTLLTAASNIMVINKWVYKNLPYDPEKDFAPIALAGTVPNMLIVHPSVPANNVRELVAYAKANPKVLNYASSGSGTTAHLAGELFKMMAGVDIVHVPYNGAAPALRDLLGGRVQLMFDNMPTALPLVKNNQVKAFGVTTLARSASLPEVPTMDEAGLKGFEASPWYGFVAPAQTPKAVISRLHSEIAAALRNPEVIAQFTNLGVTVASKGPEEFAAFMAAESNRFRQVAEKSGAKAD
jgi:tripartite-type tricarboxylate transporter receptor subunit TctC